MSAHHYTAEQIRWLRRHRPSATLPELTPRFNARFGTALSVSALDGTCQRYRIRSGTDGRFRRGLVPWNKGRKGVITGGQATQFRPGALPTTWMPVGAYRTTSDGMWWLKVRDERKTKRGANWMPVHQLTWQEAHGPIPAGHVVVFIDRNPDNCLRVDNLALVSRAVLARLNQLGWQRAPLESRGALIAMATLQQQANDAAKRLGLGLMERRRLLPSLHKLPR